MTSTAVGDHTNTTDDLTSSAGISGSVTDDLTVEEGLVLIDIEKATNGVDADLPAVAPEIEVGSIVTWTYVVTNTGLEELFSITVSDDILGAIGCPNDRLAPGVSMTCTATGVAAAGLYTNLGTATGLPAVGVPVSDDDRSHYLGVFTVAGIDIQKTPDSQVVPVGGTASFDIRVQNTSSDLSAEVTVDDPLTPDCDDDLGTLEPGEVVTYSCEVDGVIDSFENVATVTADFGGGTILTDSDIAVVTVEASGISITKTPSLQLVDLGGTASWSITVTNTSRDLLMDVTVDDPVAPGCDQVIGELSTGQFFSFTCSLAGVSTDFTNVATVTGSDGARTVSDTATADVVALSPGLEINKTPDAQVIDSGDTASFTITVTNIGATTITGIEVRDPVAPGCDADIGTLTAGDSTSYDCALADVTESFVNTAIVSVDPGGGGELEFFDEDSASVIVRSPGIDIQKDPATQLIDPGDTATFTITVTNTGREPLTDIEVADPLSPDCDADIGTLADGQSFSYVCDLTGVTDGFVNTATVFATDPVLGTVSDSGNAEVLMTGPAIDVTKTPDEQLVLGGGTAAWVITVTNSGDETLTDVTVDDLLAPDCDRDLGDFAPEHVFSYGCSLDNVQETFTNVATAEGNHSSGGGGTASDASSGLVVVPTCDGELVTIVGTTGDDVILGTEGDDVIWGWKGDDRIFGLGGDDIICGGHGSDLMAGNAGDDRIFGGAGKDTADYATAPGPVAVNLGSDSATGAVGTDVVRNVENVNGSAFDDDLRGDNGDNILQGGAGDDLLKGKGGGDDMLLGQAGDDRLYGGLGDDLMSGAGGQDWAVYITSPRGVRVDLRILGPQITRNGRDTLINIEHVVGSGKNDVLGGNSKANHLAGGKGRDFLLGRGGDDVLIGNAGIDTAFGASGTDTCAAEFEINCEL